MLIEAPFFRLKQPYDKKIIGINDGTCQAEIVESKWKDKKELKRYVEEYILGAHETNARLVKGEEVLPPSFGYIKLRNKSILTDFLTFSESYTGGNFLISNRVKIILEKHNFNGRIYENIPLYFKDKLISGYSNLHLLPLSTENCVIFEKSAFYEGSSRGFNKVVHHCKSFGDYVNLSRQKLIMPETLVLKKSTIQDLDIFTLDIFNNVYVSKQLTESLKDSKISGVEFCIPKEPDLWEI